MERAALTATMYHRVAISTDHRKLVERNAAAALASTTEGDLVVNVRIVLAEDAIPTLKVEAATAYLAAKCPLAVQDRTNLFSAQSSLPSAMGYESPLFRPFKALDIFELAGFGPSWTQIGASWSAGSVDGGH